MKNLRSIKLTVLAVIGFITISFASTPAALLAYEVNQLDDRINSEMNEIVFSNANSKEGLVLVHIVINADGTLSITESNFSDPKIYESIKKKLEAIRLADACELAGQEFNYAFKFKIID